MALLYSIKSSINYLIEAYQYKIRQNLKTKRKIKSVM